MPCTSFIISSRDKMMCVSSVIMRTEYSGSVNVLNDYKVVRS